MNLPIQLLWLSAGGKSAANAVFNVSGERVEIGRDDRCDIVIAVSSVSGRHAAIEASPSGCVFIDLSSRNGSACRRGDRPAEVIEPGVPWELRSGDVLMLGGADSPVELRVVAGLSPYTAPGGRNKRAGVGSKTPHTIVAKAPLTDLLGEHPSVGVGEERADILARFAARAMRVDSASGMAVAITDCLGALVPGAQWALKLQAPGLSLQSEAKAPAALANEGDSAQEVVLLEGFTGDTALPGSRSVLSTGAVQAVVVPLVVNGARHGAITGWAPVAVVKPADLAALSVAGSLLALAVNALGQRLVAQARADVLAADNAALRASKAAPDHVEPLGNSSVFGAALDLVRRIAPTTVTVLLTGETGTGKEVVARSLHRWSTRRDGPFVVFNCAALPESLVESELFGHVRGAFTGAAKDRAGLFEQAHGGTIFIDEIGEMPTPLQAKLLRVVQDGRVRRLGDDKERDLDVRIVTATHRDLPAMVEAGTFREDLFFRLNAVTVRLPPLRERGDDILLLAHHLVAKIAAAEGRAVPGFTAAALMLLQAHPFPGNIRELDNELRRAVALTTSGSAIDVGAFSERLRAPSPAPDVQGDVQDGAQSGVVASPGGAPVVSGESLKESVERFERLCVSQSIAAHNGNMTATAAALGLTRPGLYKVVRRLGLAAT